ncbi:MAG: hypothetical protein LLG93_09300 [Deltaproteobacteria bacterium]|nr:hypothetical protein [Deltaproteobacteria bacterium]
MPTPASQAALNGLRDLSTLHWYVIPLLAIVIYIYTIELKKARETGRWDAIFAGLAVFGMDFFNETWNGWVFHFTNYSAVWTTPGETALRTLVGWNIEIMFMFTIAGIIYYHTLPDKQEERILGIPNRWFWAVAYSAFCVFVECLLNIGGHLVWEYPFWKLSFGGIWLIFLVGYFPFFAAANLVIARKTNHRKLGAIGLIYSVPILMNLIGKGIFHWAY